MDDNKQKEELTNPIEKEEFKIYDTLVLSGGGPKGYLILGAIQSLFDHHLLYKINTFVGTSVGCMIGYLIAIGYTPIEIITELHLNKWLDNIKHFNVISMVNGNGSTSFLPLQDCLEKLTLRKIGELLTLKKLKEKYGKTLVCCTYNTTNTCEEYISYKTHPDLPCLTAIRMSSNLPLIFERFNYQNCFYIDGGICDNFPILEAEKYGENIIGVCVHISLTSLRDKPEEGIMSYIYKILQIPIRQTVYNNTEKCTKKPLIIDLKGDGKGNFFDFALKSKERLDMFSDGYQTVKKILK